MDDYLDTYIVQVLAQQKYRNGIFKQRRSLKNVFSAIRRRHRIKV